MVLEILRSPAWLEIIRMLEREHPYHTGLSSSATMDQRACHQIRVQEYEAVLGKFRDMALKARQTSVPSDYQPTQPTK